MPNWNGSDRRKRLPANWEVIRRRILRRDGHQCTHIDETGKRCTERATDVDHITPGDDHRDENLQSLCGYHHRKKSGAEGAQAVAANRRRADARFRRQEAHPGIR